MYGSAVKEQVRELNVSGMQKAEIARKLGIKSRSTIYTILNEANRGIGKARLQSNTQQSELRPSSSSSETDMKLKGRMVSNHIKHDGEINCLKEKLSKLEGNDKDLFLQNEITREEIYKCCICLAL